MITKEKNILHITLNNGKTCHIDINTGFIYGQSQRPLKNFPAGFKTTLSNQPYGKNVSWVCNILYSLCNCYNSYYVAEENRDYYGQFNNVPCSHWDEFAELFKVADKLDAIGFPSPRYSITWNDADNMRFVNRHFKDFVKYYKDNGEDTRLSEFCRDYTYIYWERTYEKALRGMDNSVKSMLYDALNNNHVRDEDIDLCIYYFKHNVAEFFNAFPNPCTSTYSQSSTNGAYYAIRHIKDVIKKANEMGYKLTKDNYFPQAVAVNKMYNIFKEKISVEKLKKVYEPRLNVLSYENDEYFVMIPQSEKDFISEASQQNNCVYSSYFNKVLENKTYVVFIRKKSNPEKSYVTCEVTKDGEIWQYLTVNNHSITDDFKAEFYKHLTQNW